MTDKNGGFTLLEVVISIAALSLISVFILQMFIASASLNDRARNADIALAAAITEIDGFKSCESASDYLDGAQANQVNNGATNGDTTVLYFYYDKDWQPLDTGAPPENGYSMMMSITREDSVNPPEDGILLGELYSAQVEVEEMRGGEKSRTLAYLSAKKYFSDSKAEMRL